jgi:hypothetical protein
MIQLASLQINNVDAVVIAAAISFILLGIGFGVVFARLISRDRIVAPLDDAEALFSPARYSAMDRLLKETDQEFLSSHPGYKPASKQKLLKVRIKIFRGYMQMLSDDFNRICRAIKVVMVSCKVDRSDLAGLIMKQQFLFAVGMLQVEFKLVLYGFGWSTVDASGLVRSLDGMRTQLQSMVAVAEPSAA